MTGTAHARASTAHPLDPLSAAEIRRAVAVLREARPEMAGARYVSVSVAEPEKDDLAARERAGTREAAVVLWDSAAARTYEARVDLVAETLAAWREVDGVQPQLLLEEVEAVERWTRAYPPFVAALRRRGIDDPSTVDIDPAPAGHHGLPEDEEGRRLARILPYLRPSPGGNAYARPIEGVFGLIDVRTGDFVQFEDRDPVPFPQDEGEYRADRVGPVRDDLRPIEITQPEGPSFIVDGHEVRWQKWRFRIGFTSREGLVLHHLGYEDSGRLRSILHRASYAEMVVPYADPDRFYQSPLDIGEFNVGTFTNSLTLGCDCLGEIRYFDAAYCAPDGSPVVIENAICMHEEDDGLLWKHTDFRTDHVEVRRARKLVISSVVTVGNYEYGFFWYLHQDGTITSEVKATGIVATKAVAAGEEPAYGNLVAPGLSAIHHQHVFCVRLDLDIEGAANTVYEVHAEPDPDGPDNPHGNAWRTVTRPLRSEQEAQRDIDIASARTWLIANPSVRNVVGNPVAYRLVPGDNTVSFSSPSSVLRRRAGFVDHHLWVTPYRPDERYPAGEYPYQHAGGEGLPGWTAADRPLHDTDVVVWYTMNHHHVVRPEDWPVMPVAKIGFMLKPWGFFDRSPALDVPPPDPACHAPNGKAGSQISPDR